MQIFNKPLKGGLKSRLLPLPPLGVRTAEGFAVGISPGAEQWALGTPDPRVLAAAREKPTRVTSFGAEPQRRHRGFGNGSQCGAEPCCMADLL